MSKQTKAPRISKEDYLQHLKDKGYTVLDDNQVSIDTILGTRVYDICNNEYSYYLVLNHC